MLQKEASIRRRRLETAAPACSPHGKDMNLVYRDSIKPLHELRLVLWAAAVSVLLGTVSLLSAQSSPAALRGTVVDSSGAVIPGAEVSASHRESGAVRETATDQAGEFTFADLPAGLYDVAARAEGFAVKRVEGVAPGRRALRIRLQPDVITQDVTVTATRSETPVTALPNAVTLLDKESIDQQRALADDLATVLENTVPGFGPSLRKMTGRAETLRGRNPLYMIDGVPQHNALRDGQRDGHTIDLDFVEEVEVIQGSNAIQGIGATGGVVNMKTKTPPADGRWRQDVRLSLSGADDFDGDSFAPKGSYLLGKQAGKFDFIGGASLMERDLFFDANGDPIGLFPTQGDIMDSTQRDFYFRTGFKPTPSQRLGFSINNFRLERNSNFVVVEGDRATGAVTTLAPGDPRPVVGDPAENDVTTMSFDYNNSELGGGDLVVQGFYQDFAALFEGGTFGGFFRLTPDGPPFLDQSEIQSQKLGVKTTYSLRDAGPAGFTPRFGLDILSDESAQILARSGREWVPETDLQGVAPFFQVEQSVFDRLTLSGGLRVETASLEVGDFTTIASAGNAFVAGGDPTFTEVLPNVGAVFHFGGGFSVFGSFNEGFTMPDVGRVLRAVSEPGQDVDDFLDLEPIVTNNTEFGARYGKGRLRTEVSYYRSTSDLGSRLQPNEELIFEVRRERTEIEGVEASARVFLHDRLSVGGNYAWLKGEFDSDGDDIVDSDLDGTNIAPNRLNLFTQFYPASWLNGRFQVSRFFDRDFRGPGAPSNADFDGYTVASLLIGFPTRAGLFRVGIENVFNEFYVTYFSQTEPVQRNDTIFAGRGRTFTFVFEPRLGFLK